MDTTWIQNVYNFYHIKAIESIYNSYSFSILYLCVTLPHNVTLLIKKGIEKEPEKPDSNILVYKNLIKVLCLLYSFLGIFWSFKKDMPGYVVDFGKQKRPSILPDPFFTSFSNYTNHKNNIRQFLFAVKSYLIN